MRAKYHGGKFGIGAARIDAREYVRVFLTKLAERERTERVRLATRGDAERVRGLLDMPDNTLYKSFRDIGSGEPYWGEQRTDYVPSNLGAGKGCVFYFLCNECGRRVKYLYRYSGLSSPLCRQCCGIGYRRRYTRRFKNDV